MTRCGFIFIFLLVTIFNIAAQEKIGYFINENKVFKSEISFKTLNNLIIIKLQINDSEPLSFILDSGSKNTIFFEDDTAFNPLQTQYSRPFELNGWGNERKLIGYVSVKNSIKIGNVLGENISVIAIDKSDMDISPFFGEKIDGILGIDIFKNLVIEIDFIKKKINFSSPKLFVATKRSDAIDVQIENDKPFISCGIGFQSKQTLPIQLLLDLGESKPLSLVVGTDSFIKFPDNFIYANLGVGLNGLISGYIGQNKFFKIGKFNLENIFTAYPDESSISKVIIKDARNGSIGMGVLNKFKLIFNLEKSKLYLQKNANFKKPFVFNRTGIEIKSEPPKYDRFLIGSVVPYTPAYIYGLQTDDELLMIDYKLVDKLAYVDILNILEDPLRDFLQIKVKRGSEIKEFNLHLFTLFN